MGKPLNNPPVYFTIAQVRFNPILKLADFLPSIQESFRQARYPDFVKNVSMAIQPTMQDGRLVPVVQPKETYAFGKAAKTHGFLLDENALTFQSTDYGHFELFSEEFVDGLERVHSLVHLDYTERVGLRYLDRVAPVASDPLAKYLAPEALGLSARLKGEVSYSFCETLTQVNGAKLLSRVIARKGPIGFPPDLLPVGLELAPRFKGLDGEHALLDNDGFVEGRESYSVETVREHLETVHTVIGVAFRATVTEYAFKMWDK
jgi:uncharacterized protein (TIGR04255 family)